VGKAALLPALKRNLRPRGMKPGGAPPPISKFKGWTIDNLAVAAVAELAAHSATQRWLYTWNPGRWDNSKDALEWELDILEQLATYRDGVMAEAVTQANGIVPYFQGLVGFTEASHPQTTNLCFIALNLAAFAVMYYKHKFNRPRPSQLRPSFPSGHSTQSHLIAHFLERAIGIKHPAYELLHPLGNRIAINREVMGLHYRSDSVAGEELAEKLDALTQKVAYNTSGANAKRKRAAKVVNPAIIRDILDKAETEWA
jgi:membrane-associated phospholipid phosphatase